MKIKLDDTEIEVNNDKLDEIFQQQKRTLSDVADVYKQNDDMQGLLYFMVSWNSITQHIINGILGECGEGTIISILNGAEQKG